MKKIDWMSEAKNIQSQLALIREELHMNPELGNRERRTADRIEQILKAHGWDVERPFGTAVLGRMSFGEAVINTDDKANGSDADDLTVHTGEDVKATDEMSIGGRERCVGLRADMDALPVRETSGVDFASRNEGVMHACGHDVHMTCVLGTAMLLAGHRSELRGTALLFFEPDEETNGGAERFAESGCLDGVSAVFGAHVSPDIPDGCVGIRYGKMYAASSTFSCTVRGVSAHGAAPDSGVDALQAAAEAVQALRRLPEEYEDSCVVSVGTLHSGSKENLIADRAEFTGIIRTLGAENRAAMVERIRCELSELEKTTGAEFVIDIRESYGGVTNPDEETRLAENALRELIGDERVVIIDEPTMTTEDFGVYIDRCGGGSFYHLGAGCDKPLHSSDFVPAESALPLGAAAHAKIVSEYLLL